MTIYTVYTGLKTQPLQDTELFLVEEKFFWSVFLFGPLLFLWRRAWFGALLYFSCFLLFLVFLSFFPSGVGGFALLFFHFLFALYTPYILQKEGERRGYHLADLIPARNRSEVYARYFLNRMAKFLEGEKSTRNSGTFLERLRSSSSAGEPEETEGIQA